MTAFSAPQIGTGSKMAEEPAAQPLDLLAVGELLVDLISDERIDTLGDARGFRVYVGGQAANVAHNIARLGGRSAIVGRVGDDGFGALCRREMAAAGVGIEWLAADPALPTTLVTIARSVSTPDFTIYRGADRRLDPGDVPMAALQRARAVHASAFALSREPARGAVLAALAAARRAGALVTLDPTYHPKVWGSADPLPVLAAAYRFVDVTKPSLDDCHRLFGPGGSAETYARRFLELGARLVVLTLGADGALLATADGVVRRFPGRPVPVADVTGAGDAFWSGLIMGLLDGLSAAEAVAAGMEVAAIKIQQVGPLGALPDRRLIYRQAALHLG